MEKHVLLGSLFLRIASIYAGTTHSDLAAHRKHRRRKKVDHEDVLEKARWKVELLSKTTEEASHKANGSGKLN